MKMSREKIQRKQSWFSYILHLSNGTEGKPEEINEE
jgi:hypothetical protein